MIKMLQNQGVTAGKRKCEKQNIGSASAKKFEYKLEQENSTDPDIRPIHLTMLFRTTKYTRAGTNLCRDRE